MDGVRRVSGDRSIAIDAGWQLASIPIDPKAPARAIDPSQLDTLGLDWIDALVPGTAASTLRRAGRFSFDTPIDFDAREWWYRATLAIEPAREGERIVLFLGGLATLATVWLNGEEILSSDNMFHAHEVDVTSRVRGDDALVIRFASLRAAIAEKKPRPRWKVRIVADQQIRWRRTTLLGRIPAWSPPVAPVGPWRAIRVERRSTLSIESVKLHSTLVGDDGRVEIALEATSIKATPRRATLIVGDRSTSLDVSAIESRFTIAGSLEIKAPERWWPHTHGAQRRYAARVDLTTASGDVLSIDLGHVAFRTIDVDARDGAFTLRVNGVEVFCRGACWTPLDIVSLDAGDAATRAAIEQARDAGMNMIRVGGTMVYESPAFYEACDELGILVWQDFMFANMDYPSDDAAFVASVRREASELLTRLQSSPSLAVLCGNSEAEQQAAMLGMPREAWKQALFETHLLDISTTIRGDVPYVTSSPTGGALPFELHTGVSHYYGVGAYLRPLEDARRAEVRFTSECLGFANVPSDALIESLLGDGQVPTNHPRWKSRVPRDGGAGWDFDDVRDHYLRTLFGVDPAALKYSDVARYLQLSRVVTGEVIAATISEWRRPKSTCRGALVWWLRDLWPGAGWGLVDSTGAPKASFFYARRAMQATALAISDEGLDGLALHALNDRPTPIECELSLTLLRKGSVRVAHGSTTITVPAHGATSVFGNALFDHFVDSTEAYRFGPPMHDVAVATLRARDGGGLIAEAFHFPRGFPADRRDDLGLTADASPLADGAWALTLRTNAFAQSIAIEARAFAPDDDFFHLAPGESRVVKLTPTSRAPRLQGAVFALNATTATRIAWAVTPSASKSAGG